MRSVFLTPKTILSGIAVLTVLCMAAVGLISDRLAVGYMTRSAGEPAIRLHLIEAVMADLQHAQDCRRAFLATRDTSYMDSFRASCAQVEAALDRLLARDQEIAIKLAYAADLKDVVHEKLASVNETLAAAARGENGPRQSPDNDTDMNRISKLLGSLAQQEASDESGDRRAAHERTIFHEDLVIALLVVNVLFLTGVVFCAIQIGKLQNLVTMCAWSRRVQLGEKWIPLEEYLKKRFGIRISHGISQEEYEKWSADLMAAPLPSSQTPPQAVA